MGLAWSNQLTPSLIAHSTSARCPIAVSASTANREMFTISEGAIAYPTGVVCPGSWRTTLQDARSTHHRSQSDVPSTTAVPRPGALFSTTADVSPEIGSAVNATPATSETTMACTRTAMRGSSFSSGRRGVTRSR